MPFRHADRSHGLTTRIDMEVRERLEEAIDYVCLDALVRSRRARGLPPPAADNPADRRDYAGNVREFLELLRRELTAGLGADQQRKLAATDARGGDEDARLIGVQVALARMLPDYWQRFDLVRARYLAEPTSSSEGGGGLLARLFRRG
jgi:hypothetical protein